MKYCEDLRKLHSFECCEVCHSRPDKFLVENEALPFRGEKYVLCHHGKEAFLKWVKEELK